MEAEAKDRTLAAYQILRDMYASNAITLDDFGKLMVSLAYEFMVGDEPSLAIGLIHEVPEAYYKDCQPEQLVKDDEYAAMCTWMSNQLAIRGIIADESLPEVNYVKAGLA